MSNRYTHSRITLARQGILGPAERWAGKGLGGVPLSKRTTWSDLVVIALIAAVSIAVKPYLRAPFAFVQTALGMPVGVFVGGIYMFWPLLAGFVVPRRGVVLLTCLLQGLLAVATGFVGLLGPMAFFSYVAPGLAIEALYLLPGSPAPGPLWSVAGGALGNVAGAATNALLFFALRGAAFTLALTSSLLTGAAGGWLAAVVGRRVAGVYRRQRNAPVR